MTYEKRQRLAAILTLIASMVLFGVSIARGATIQVATSPDGQWRVELSDSASATKFELYSTPAVGGARRRISGDVPFDFDVAEFAISPDSRRVAFRKGRTATGAWGLYSVPINGGAVAPLSAGLTFVEAGYSVTSADVHARGTEVAGAPLSEFVVPIAGGARRVPKIFADGFETGSTGGWR